MNIFYFGADSTWQDLQSIGFRRRNTCILKALTESDVVSRIFVVRKLTRGGLTKIILRLSKTTPKSKVKDVYFASLLPEKRIPFATELNRLTNRYLLRLQCEREISGNEILWAYWPKGFLHVEESGLKGHLVFDADHNIVDDPNLVEDARKSQEKLLFRLASQSRWLLASTRSMLTWFNDKGFTQTYRLRNGVDPDRFHFRSNKQNRRFTVGYCGTLSKWIDYDLFGKIISNHPEWDFVIIGVPYLCNEWEALKQYSNVLFLGNKTADEVPKLMSGFNAAINVYRELSGLDADSMKLYEYIAAGVPVVCTRYHKGLEEDFDGLLLLGDSADNLGRHLNSIKEGWHFDIEAASSFLKNSRWSSRINQFIELLPND